MTYSTKEAEVRIGYLSTMYHSSLPIKGMRLLEKEGIQPVWSLFGTGPAIIDAFAKDRLDIGYIGLAPTAIGVGKGIKIKCVAGGHVEGTVIAAKRNYCTVEDFGGNMAKTLAQFKGKKIGVPRRGSLHDVFLRHYIAQCGLENEVKVVNYDWADLIPEAISDGEVEAAAGTPPLAVLLSRLFDARIIIPPRMIWPNNPSYGIVTSSAMLHKSQEILERFLKVHKEVCCRMLRNDRQSVAESVANTVGLVDKQFVLDTYGVSPKYCAALSREFIDSTLRLNSVLKGLGYLSSDLGKEDIFDLALIDRVHREAPHYS